MDNIEPKVLNKYTATYEELKNAVYIGRGSPWGNKYIIGYDGDRMEVITKYTVDLFNNPELMSRMKRELKGKSLICFCKPKHCHGDIVFEVANAP